MKKILLALAFVSSGAQANVSNEVATESLKVMVGALVQMQIDTSCLKQVNSFAKTYIANPEECTSALVELTETLSGQEGIESELDFIESFKAEYQL